MQVLLLILIKRLFIRTDITPHKQISASPYRHVIIFLFPVHECHHTISNITLINCIDFLNDIDNDLETIVQRIPLPD